MVHRARGGTGGHGSNLVNSLSSHSPTVALRKGGVVPLLERRLGRVRDYAGVSPADPLKPPVSPWRARSLRSWVEG